LFGGLLRVPEEQTKEEKKGKKGEGGWGGRKEG
jgi:hypothetical protein